MDLTLDKREELKEDGLEMAPEEAQEFVVDANATTGFMWIWDKDSANGVFTVCGMYSEKPHPDGMVGAPGVEDFMLTVNEDAEQGDQAVFRAIYARPFEFAGWEGVDSEAVEP